MRLPRTAATLASMRTGSAFIAVEDYGAIGGIGVFPSIESYVRLRACYVIGYTRDRILLGLKRPAEEAQDGSDVAEYETRFEREYGFSRLIIRDVVERYLDCGNSRRGKSKFLHFEEDFKKSSYHTRQRGTSRLHRTRNGIREFLLLTRESVEKGGP